MKQKDFEKTLSIYSYISLDLVKKLVLTMSLVIQENVKLGVRSNIPRLGAIKVRLRAAKTRYDIHAGMPVLMPAVASPYMVKAGYQQRYFDPDYQVDKVFKEERNYPANELARQLNVNSGIDILLCNRFLVNFVDLIIQIGEENESVSIRKLGTFKVKEIFARPVEITLVNEPIGEYFYSNYINKWLAPLRFLNDEAYFISSSFNTWKGIAITPNYAVWDIKISEVSGIYLAIFRDSTNRYIANSIDGKDWIVVGRPFDIGYQVLGYLPLVDTFFVPSPNLFNAKVMFSASGIDWEIYDFPSDHSVELFLIANNASYIIASGYRVVAGVNIAFVAISSNIAGWSFYDDPERPRSGVCAYSPSMDFWVSLNPLATGGIISVSSGGTAWSYITLPIIISLSAASWSASLNLFMIAGLYSGTIHVLLSADGFSWSVYDTGFTGQIRGSLSKDQGDKLAIFIDRDSALLSLVSDDGINWHEEYGSYTRQVINFKPSQTLKNKARQGLTP